MMSDQPFDQPFGTEDQPGHAEPEPAAHQETSGNVTFQQEAAPAQQEAAPAQAPPAQHGEPAWLRDAIGAAPHLERALRVLAKVAEATGVL